MILWPKFCCYFQVRYTGYRDRPLHERQTKFICALREGHTEIVRRDNPRAKTYFFKFLIITGIYCYGFQFDPDIRSYSCLQSCPSTRRLWKRTRKGKNTCCHLISWKSPLLHSNRKLRSAFKKTANNLTHSSIVLGEKNAWNDHVFFLSCIMLGIFKTGQISTCFPVNTGALQKVAT